MFVDECWRFDEFSLNSLLEKNKLILKPKKTAHKQELKLITIMQLSISSTSCSSWIDTDILEASISWNKNKKTFN